MRIYEWDSGNAKLLVRAEGCVVQEDLFGVRLTDVDGDGVFEILTVGLPVLSSKLLNGLDQWHDFNRNSQIYKWNGTAFTYWKDLPSK
jgi:hypothetical protein